MWLGTVALVMEIQNTAAWLGVAKSTSGKAPYIGIYKRYMLRGAGEANHFSSLFVRVDEPKTT